LHLLCSNGRIRGSVAAIIIIIIIIISITIINAIELSPGGSSPTLVQTKIKIHKTTITTKQLQNIKKHKTTK
jgi:hypothetical protein